MRKVDLRVNELRKYEIIKDVVYKRTSVHRASVLLNCSIRNIYKLKKLFLNKGKEGFIHGNRNRKPSTTLPDNLINEIVTLYSNKFFDSNFQHFNELLETFNIKVSYNALYRILTEKGFISPKCHRITKRKKNIALRQKLKNNEKLLEPETNYIATSNLQDPILSHPRKPRAKYYGELLQMDASEHLWFGDYKTFLHVSIDDATGSILGAYFDYQETLKGYYNVLYQILTKDGIPAKFLTDNRTIFEFNKHKHLSDEKDTFTQFGYACHQLGIELITSSTPQVKGRVERLFQTLQSRLIVELRIAGIKNVQEANEFLPSFILNFNKRFSVPSNYTTSVFEKQISQEKINYTLAVISKRVIDNGNAVKYKNKYYQFYDDDSLVCIKPKTQCCVLEAFDGSLLASVGETVYTLKELARNKSHSEMFDIDEPKKQTYKGHKPKYCHPWTYYSYKTRMRRRSA